MTLSGGCEADGEAKLEMKTNEMMIRRNRIEMSLCIIYVSAYFLRNYRSFVFEMKEIKCPKKKE